MQCKLGKTALIHATSVFYNNKINNIVEILLNHKANVNIQDNEGKTALMHLILNKYTISYICQILISMYRL